MRVDADASRVVELEQTNAVLANVVAKRLGVHRSNRLGCAAKRLASQLNLLQRFRLLEVVVQAGLNVRTRIAADRPAFHRTVDPEPHGGPELVEFLAYRLQAVGKPLGIALFERAAVVDPEVHRVQVEMAARLPLPLGYLGEVVQQKVLGLVEIAVGPGPERLEDGVGLVVASNDASHAASDMGHESLSRCTGLGHAVHRLHALKRLARRQPDSRVLAQRDLAAGAFRRAGRMRQREEELVGGVDREAALHVRASGQRKLARGRNGIRTAGRLVDHLRAGHVVATQSHVEQAIPRAGADIVDRYELPQHRLFGVPAIGHHGRSGRLLGGQVKDHFTGLALTFHLDFRDFQLRRLRAGHRAIRCQTPTPGHCPRKASGR